MSNPANLSLLWNTDGVPIFKSSNYSIWSLYFSINELPYEHRMRKQNILLGGLWFGDAKPNIHVFLQPIIKVLLRFEDGITVEVWGVTAPILSKIIVLAGTSDLPAKSLILNIRQFNGFNGCPRCLQSGETLKLGPRSHTHIYHFSETNPSGLLRTKESIQEDMMKTFSTGSPTNGVLGLSWLGSLQYYDMAKGTGIDYMHCCLLGVVRKMLGLMLDSKNHDRKFYIGKSIRLLNGRLTSIKAIAEISRAPRPLSDHKHWKASEFRSFLLYYPLPVLNRILDAEYYLHFSLLVVAIRKLLSESISQKNLELAEKFLILFCKNYQHLYGKRGMTINVHSVLHLPQVVRDLGPLWAYSCFFFEGLNGVLLKNIHGTQYVGLQCVRTFSMLQGFPALEEMLDIPYHNTPSFMKKLTCSFAIRESEPKPLGRLKSNISEGVKNLLKKSGQDYECHFTRLRTHGITYHSLLWKEQLKRQNYVIEFSHPNSGDRGYGQIESFIQHYDSSCTTVSAVVRVFDCSIPFKTDVPTDGLYEATETETLILLNISQLLGKCLYMKIYGLIYLSTLVDIFERD